MTLKELQPQLLALTPEEKSQAIQLLVQSLSNTWQGIEKNPGVMGGDAGIIVCTEDLDRQRLAIRINEAIINAEPLINKLVRVTRPSQ